MFETDWNISKSDILRKRRESYINGVISLPFTDLRYFVGDIPKYSRNFFDRTKPLA